ncbi:MAG: hypothetical protein QF554_07125 [Dehalococcoidia bacterium]|nr:hypothetical protein [Dehalococcoidia bacterium]
MPGAQSGIPKLLGEQGGVGVVVVGEAGAGRTDATGDFFDQGVIPLKRLV